MAGCRNRFANHLKKVRALLSHLLEDLHLYHLPGYSNSTTMFTSTQNLRCFSSYS
uniref:Uncharacterized protein LOC8281738 n=1 Tax=Rhizophora mucronata TaxID=61149 RepID=A0A2P2IYT5_RHIMU